MKCIRFVMLTEFTGSEVAFTVMLKEEVRFSSLFWSSSPGDDEVIVVVVVVVVDEGDGEVEVVVELVVLAVVAVDDDNEDEAPGWIKRFASSEYFDTSGP
jgi:hypothetical protein